MLILVTTTFQQQTMYTTVHKNCHPFKKWRKENDIIDVKQTMINVSGFYPYSQWVQLAPSEN